MKTLLLSIACCWLLLLPFISIAQSTSNVVVDSFFSIGNLTTVNGKLFFNGIDNQMRDGLWVTDGTAQGTKLLNYRPLQYLFSPYVDNDTIYLNRINILTAYNNQLLFSGYDSIHNVSLWITDGTPAGTKFIKHFSSPDSIDIFATPLLHDGLAHFYVGQIYDSTGEYGIGEAISDGTPGGTKLDSSGFDYQNIGYAVNCGNYQYESEYDLDYQQTGHLAAIALPDSIWNTDGTGLTIDTFQCLYTPGGYNVYGACIVNYVSCMGNELYFDGGSDVNSELWKTDGTVAGTIQVKDIWPGYEGSNPTQLTTINNQLYFDADDSVHGPQVWVSDGTTAGTQPLTQVPGGYTGFFIPINEKVLISNDTSGLALTDGTTAGTNFTPFYVGTNNLISYRTNNYYESTPQTFYTYNQNYLYSLADVNPLRVFNYILKTDGTIPNTHLIYLDTGSLGFTQIDTMGSEVYFVNRTNRSIPANYGPFKYYKLEKLTGADSVYNDVREIAYNSLKFYPNPAQTTVSIQCDNCAGQNTLISLFDIAGNKVAESAVYFSGIYPLDISHISSGIYILQLLNNQGMLIGKLIKQ